MNDGVIIHILRVYVRSFDGIVVRGGRVSRWELQRVMQVLDKGHPELKHFVGLWLWLWAAHRILCTPGYYILGVLMCCSGPTLSLRSPRKPQLADNYRTFLLVRHHGPGLGASDPLQDLRLVRFRCMNGRRCARP